jgi:hypothetical protein
VEDRSTTYGDGTGIDLCGARTYTLTGPSNFATFASIIDNGDATYDINIDTSTDSLVGQHTVIM